MTEGINDEEPQIKGIIITAYWKFKSRRHRANAKGGRSRFVLRAGCCTCFVGRSDRMS